MKCELGEKIRYLREVEGSLRGLGRPMTQLELIRAKAKVAARKLRQGAISQSYLSQIENGARPHMTQSSRALLAKFFKVHPGFLVDDPDGYHAELTSDLRTTEGQLDVWLLQGSEKFRERSGSQRRADQGRARKRYAPLLSAAGRDSRYARTGRPSARSFAAGIGGQNGTVIAAWRTSPQRIETAKRSRRRIRWQLQK